MFRISIGIEYNRFLVFFLKKATSTTVKEKDTKKSTGGKTVLKTAKGARDYSTEEMALREQVKSFL